MVVFCHVRSKKSLKRLQRTRAPRSQRQGGSIGGLESTEATEFRQHRIRNQLRAEHVCDVGAQHRTPQFKPCAMEKKGTGDDYAKIYVVVAIASFTLRAGQRPNLQRAPQFGTEPPWQSPQNNMRAIEPRTQIRWSNGKTIGPGFLCREQCYTG